MKAGQVVAGKYRLDARLGIGGMGEVWKATHAGTDREFALKFMHPHVSTSATARQRFAREAKVSAKINHPNVIDIFDVGEMEDDVLFLAMELLDGVSLADALHATQPLSVREFLTVILDTARALAAAHAAGVVHRDLKPGNIFLHKDRATGFAAAKILDFGISKLGGESEHTKTGAVLGSPRYMSPEQTRSAASVDHRTDLWAMGVILFEGLTGTWPHEGDSFSSLVVAICTTPPTSIDLMVPGLSEPLRAIVRDCLKPLDQRLSSAAELASRLAAVLADPTLERMPLPRPLHAPTESVRTVSSVRVRPPLLTTTGSGAPSPESLRTTQPERGVPDSLVTTRPRDALPPRGDGADEDATVVRIPPSRDVSMGQGAAPTPPAPSPPAYPAAHPPPDHPLGGTQPLDRLSSPGSGPVFKPHSKTIPLNVAAAMHAELLRAGVFGQSATGGTAPLPAFSPQQAVSPPTPLPQSTPIGPSAPRPPDPLLGTVSRNNFETRPSTLPDPRPMTPFTPVPAPATPAPAGSGKALGVVAAALSVVLAGLVIAIVSVLGGSPQPATTAGDPSTTAAAPAAPPGSEAPSAAAPSASASAPVEPAPTATATAATPRPAPSGRVPGPLPAGPSKVKQLGSGL